MNRLNRTILTLAAAVTLWVHPQPNAAAQNQDKAEVTLKAAMDKEIVDGDLKAAIEQYGKLSQSANRAVAAKALVRMGQCYEKLGDAEARKAYERAIRDFGDQKEAVAQARVRLAALGGARAEGGVIARQVWSAPEADPEGAITADGRLMSLTHWDTGDLAVRDLQASKTKLVTNKGPWEKNWEFSGKSAISPDGKQIAYNWCSQGKNDMCAAELRISNLDGSNRRTLFGAGGPELWMEPHAWTPDGKRILVDETSKGTRQIGWLNVADGSFDVLKKLPPRRAQGNLILSRDGKWIGYSHSGTQGNSQKDVFVIASAGGPETAVVAGPSDDYPLAWTLDGKGLLFASDRGGSRQIWVQPLAGGKQQGAPRLVHSKLEGTVPLGMARNGSLYLGGGKQTRDVFSVRLDADKDGPNPPELLITGNLGANGPASFSPDGTRIAYGSGDRPASQEFSTTRLVIRTVATGEERVIAPDMDSFVPQEWHPSGKSILVHGTDKDRRLGLFLVDDSTGAVTPLLLAPDGVFIRRPSLSPDGRMLYYHKWQDGKFGYVVRNLESGQEQPFTTSKLFGGSYVTFSPDGREVAISVDGSLKVMAPDETGAREIYRCPDRYFCIGSSRGRGLSWAPDGKSLYAVASIGKGAGMQVVRISLDGEQPEVIAASAREIQSISLHPDGRQLVYTEYRFIGEIWVLENIGTVKVD